MFYQEKKKPKLKSVYFANCFNVVILILSKIFPHTGTVYIALTHLISGEVKKVRSWVQEILILPTIKY